MSTTATGPQGEGWLPEQMPGLPPSLQGGGNDGVGVSSHEVQSLPGVPGQGVQAAPALQFPERHLGGSGFMAQVEFRGSVPWSTKVPCMARRDPLFHWRACLLLSNWSGCFWKHSSVKSWPAGQSLYWYPPPWLAVICQITSAGWPAFHTVAVGRGGRREPRSPWWARLVLWYSPHSAASPPQGVPPASPQASRVGEDPGALQGLCL